MDKRTAVRTISVKVYGKPLLVALLFGTAVIAVLLLIGAFVLWKVGSLDTEFLNGIHLVILIVAGFVSGWTVGKITRKRGLLFGCLAGLLLYSIIFTVSVSCGVFRQFVALSGVRLLILLCSGAVGGMLSVNKRQKVK